MKAIINNKRYDTETSTHIASFHNGLSRSDFNHITENLYRTQKGNWFLVADGGANTKYSVPAGNMWSGVSDQFVALTHEEALQWLEKHEEVGVIEKYFSDQIEDA